MNKKQLVFVVVAAIIVAGVALLGGDFFSGMTQLADPKPGV